jgi:hypothetical protein
VGTPHDTPLIDRFMARIEIEESGCWRWTAGTNDGGYGRFAVSHDLNVAAHRWSYEHHIGPIPDGLTIHHRCENRACVNPEHLEPLTLRANLLASDTPAARNAAKTHCPRGHAYDGTGSKGERTCRRCATERQRRYLARKTAS